MEERKGRLNLNFIENLIISDMVLFSKIAGAVTHENH
jgi:hypothetical protein